MELEHYLRQLDNTTSLEEVKEVCRAYTNSISYDYYHIGIVWLTNLIRPPYRVITNIVNNIYPRKIFTQCIQEAYKYNEPLIINQGIRTLRDVRGEVKTQHDGLAYPVHTTSQQFICFSIHHAATKTITNTELFASVSNCAIFAQQLSQVILRSYSPFKVRANNLHRREHQYLELMANGKSYSDIASFHEISTDSITHHIKKAKLKLQAKNQSQAVAKALLLGYLKVKF